MSSYSYGTLEPPMRPRNRDRIERRALKIAFSEGRTEISQLDRIRAERELSLPENGT